MSSVVFSQHAPLALELELPWVIDEEREARFKRNAKITIAGVVAVFTLMQFLPVFELQEDKQDIVLTTLVLEEKKEEPKAPEPEPKKVKPKPKPVQKVAKVKKAKAAPAKPKKPQSVVTSQGLDALSSQLSSLTGSVDMKKMRKKNVSRSTRGRVAQAQTEHLSKDQVSQRSAGVNVSDQVMRADVAQLSGHQTAEVEGLNLSGALDSNNQSYGDLRAGMRDMESIRRALEAVRSRVNAIYQRELDNAPELAGKFMFKIIIEPSGEISKLSLLNSELGVIELEKAILEQIRRVRFGQDDVIATTVNYTFVFLPS